jgi:hypothetical protein
VAREGLARFEVEDGWDGRGRGRAGMSCKATRSGGNAKNEASNHVVPWIELCDLVARERKDKVAEIAVSWCE